MVGYERTIGKHQSVSANIGRFSLPRLVDINTDSIQDITSETNSKGFHGSIDYRFYLSRKISTILPMVYILDLMPHIILTVVILNFHHKLSQIRGN